MVTSDWTADIRTVLVSLRFKLMALFPGVFELLPLFAASLHFIVHVGLGMPRKSAQ
jgi:hypothetical protein